MDIARFADKSDPGYDLVSGIIEEWVETLDSPHESERVLKGEKVIKCTYIGSQ